MNEQFKTLVKNRLDSLNTVEGSKGVIILYKGVQLIMPSGKRVWSKRQHASSALANALYGIFYDAHRNNIEYDRTIGLGKQLEKEGLIEFKTLE